MNFLKINNRLFCILFLGPLWAGGGGAGPVGPAERVRRDTQHVGPGQGRQEDPQHGGSFQPTVRPATHQTGR